MPPPPRPGRAQGAGAERSVSVPRMIEKLAALGNALRRKVIELAGGHDGADARVLGFDPEAVHRALSAAGHRLVALLARFELRAMRERRAAAKDRVRTPAEERKRLAAAAKRAEAAAEWAAKLAEFDALGLDRRYRRLKRDFGTPPQPRRSERLARLTNLALTIINFTDAEVVGEVCRDLSTAANLLGQSATAAAVEALRSRIAAKMETEAEAAEQTAEEARRDAAPPDAPFAFDSDPYPQGTVPEPPHWRPPD